MVSQGVDVQIHPGRPGAAPRPALEVDLGAPLPVAFSGLRRLIQALAQAIPDLTLPEARAEWAWLFPSSARGAAARTETAGRELFDLADAPNQRRLFRESEQTYRVLNLAAHVVVAAVRTLDGPLCLRNTGACDLVSLRGLMHAVELARLNGRSARWQLCDWSTSHREPGQPFAATRAAHRAEIARRLRASWQGGALPARDGARALDGLDATGFARGVGVGGGGGQARAAGHFDDGLEGRYLGQVVDGGASLAQRLAAALLAVRACFFSTNYEGATLAAETGLALLDRDHPGRRLDGAALRAAWDAEDDPRFAIPMLELERSDLDDPNHLRAQFHLHLGVTAAFAGQTQDALDAFARGLQGDAGHGAGGRRLSPGCLADLHMHRAVALTKRLGRLDQARGEIDAGLAALADQPRAVAGLPEAWLRNLSALTYVMEKKLDRARQEEERALACIDGIDGPSATHLKTNLVSNFSVLAEAEGHLAEATRIWRAFEPLNRKLGSDNADKVHAFRLGVLRSLQGDPAGAADAFETAFAKAERTGDIFNGETIAAALARLALGRGARGAAADWYGRAAELAGAAGDCLHRARDLAGLEVARGGHDFSEARACLAANSTYALAGLPLPEALRSGAGPDVVEALGPPRHKLTRPFDLVNV